MKPIRVTVTGVGVSDPVPMNLNMASPFNATVAALLNGATAATYTVQHTYDDVWSPSFDPSAATWFPLAALTAQTADKEGYYTSPVTAIRLNVASSDGSVTLVILQSGI